MRTIEIVQEIFSQPTAPFCEGWVLAQIEQILQKNKIPYFYDESRNLIAGVKSPTQLKRTQIGFIAHTDHPGFIIQNQVRPRTYRALWYGGGPLMKMKGAKLAIYHPLTPGFCQKGVISQFKTQDYTREGLEFELKTANSLTLINGAFGTFDFPGFKMRGTKIISRAADDLAGVAIILGMLIDLKKNLNGRFIGLFTRAEEVGFVGLWALLKANLLNKKTALVSLEASKALPGAVIGKGPVLRIGDASTIFDSDLSVALWHSARETKCNFQRRLMDGGSCEATAVRLFGFRTTGIAVPLGNYHNVGPHGPAPEHIDLRDVESARQICTHFAKSFENKKSKTYLNKNSRGRLEKNFKSLKSLLHQKVAF